MTGWERRMLGDVTFTDVHALRRYLALLEADGWEVWSVATRQSGRSVEATCIELRRRIPLLEGTRRVLRHLLRRSGR